MSIMQKQLTRSHPATSWPRFSVSHPFVKIAVLILVVLAVLPMLYTWLPSGDDWPGSFRPAALMLLHGQSPYSAALAFYNPPWGLLPIIPIALLPFQLGRLVLFVGSLAAFAYGARRLTSKPISILLFLTSAPIAFCLMAGNLDGLLMLAFVTPAPFALILAAIKPQVGAGIALYWLIISWQQGGARQVIRNFLPVGLLLIASFVLYGFYPSTFPQLNHASWNAVPFPYLVPIGILFLVALIRRQDKRPVMSSGLFFSPYVGFQSLFAFMVPLLEQPKLLAVAWALSWAVVLVRPILK